MAAARTRGSGSSASESNVSAGRPGSLVAKYRSRASGAEASRTVTSVGSSTAYSHAITSAKRCTFGSGSSASTASWSGGRWGFSASIPRTCGSRCATAARAASGDNLRWTSQYRASGSGSTVNTRRSTSSGAELFMASPAIHSACRAVSASNSRRASARAASDVSDAVVTSDAADAVVTSVTSVTSDALNATRVS